MAASLSQWDLRPPPPPCNNLHPETTVMMSVMQLCPSGLPCVLQLPSLALTHLQPSKSGIVTPI